MNLNIIKIKVFTYTFNFFLNSFLSYIRSSFFLQIFKENPHILFINHSYCTTYDPKKSHQNIMLTFKYVTVTTVRWHLVKRYFLAFLFWIFHRIIRLAPMVTLKCWWTQTSLYFHFLWEDIKGMYVKSYQWGTAVVYRGFRSQQWEREEVSMSNVFQYASGKFLIT